MRRLLAIRRYAVFLPLVITAALWGFAKWEMGMPEDPLEAVSELISLLGLVGFSIVMIISARSRSIEKIYGGLDKSYKLHGKVAKISFLAILAHPFLLIPSRLEDMPWTSLVVPFGPWPDGYEMARWYGTLSLYLFVILIALTVWRRTDYQIWLNLHKLMGVAFVLGVLHAFTAASDIEVHEPLRMWMAAICGLGVIAWVYKTFLYSSFALQYRYRVDALEDRGHGFLELRLQPTVSRMNYEPGEFAFISVKGNPKISAEPHPFSIASSPVQRVLKFAYREVGDYTRSLREIKSGDEVRVYGPYGEFTSFQLDEYKRQVWVAGGIGVTPFLSMLSHEALNDDEKQIRLFYSTARAEDGVYENEVVELAEKVGPRVEVIRHVSKEEGFLTAAKLIDGLGDPKDLAFLFCGPAPMMRALEKQLVALGVARDQIHFEEFDFV